MTTTTIWQAALGPGYDRLPAALRRFHGLRGRHVLTGWATVTPPATVLAMAVAAILDTPRHAGRHRLRFTLDAGPTSEAWSRAFADHEMSSRLTLEGEHIVERVGRSRLVSMGFAVQADQEGLRMRLAWMRVLGMPCPRALLPDVTAREQGCEVDGIARVGFEVRASLSWIGDLTCYRGHLDLTDPVA